MGERCLCTNIRRTNLSDDNRLARSARRFKTPHETRAVLAAFHIKENYLNRVVIGVIFKDFRQTNIAFISGRRPQTDPELPVARFIVGNRTIGAALANYTNGAELRRFCLHGETESHDHAGIEAGKAHAVGAHDPHTRSTRDLKETRLGRLPFGPCLGKARTEYDRRFDTFLRAGCHGVLYHCRRKRNQREINVARHVCERLIGLYALNFAVVWIDRIDIAGIIIMLEIENGPAADLLLIRRRAHDSDRTRAKQDVQVSLLDDRIIHRSSPLLNETGPASRKSAGP